MVKTNQNISFELGKIYTILLPIDAVNYTDYLAINNLNTKIIPELMIFIFDTSGCLLIKERFTSTSPRQRDAMVTTNLLALTIKRARYGQIVDQNGRDIAAWQHTKMPLLQFYFEEEW